MKAVLTVIKEQINSFYLISRLSAYEIKSANKNNYLGILWEIINPMIQIAIYWFVFGYGIHSHGKGRGKIDGIEYFPWLLSAITVWFFANPAILQGSKSIYTRIKMIAKMSFPMSIIPTYVIIAKFYQHLMLLAVIVVILQFYGYTVSIHYLELPYYMFALIVFLIAISLITSTLSMIVRDVQMVVQAIMRVLIYLTPFLWSPQTLPEWVQNIMKLNPLYYIAQGYRSSLLGKQWFLAEHWQYTIYFWVVVLILLIFGSMIHVKFRNRFVDFL